MTQIVANLNEVEAWGGEIVQLPPGPYNLRVKAADVEEKAGEGGKVTTQLVVTYEVTSGAFAGKTPKAWFTLDFTKETPRKRLKALIVATGVPLDPQGNFDTAQLVGCQLNADVVVSTYESAPEPITGKSVTKESHKVVNERPYAPLGVASAPSGTATPGVSVGGAKPLPGLTKVG